MCNSPTQPTLEQMLNGTYLMYITHINSILTQLFLLSNGNLWDQIRFGLIRCRNSSSTSPADTWNLLKLRKRPTAHNISPPHCTGTEQIISPRGVMWRLDTLLLTVILCLKLIRTKGETGSTGTGLFPAAGRYQSGTRTDRDSVGTGRWREEVQREENLAKGAERCEDKFMEVITNHRKTPE